MVVGVKRGVGVRFIVWGVELGCSDGAWEGCAESAAGGFDEGVEHAFPDCFGWRVDAGGR